MSTALPRHNPATDELNLLRDLQLVAAARNGDMNAFERLYRIHSAKVMGLCLRMTRRRDVAEDCLQQTFIRAWRGLHHFEGRSAVSTWLHRIAVNEVLMRARNRDTRDESNDDAIAAAEGHEDRRQTMGDVMDMERALASLPSGCRHVVVLQTIYGYSHEEVAGMLGIAVGTCKAQLHRGRRLLRERLGLAETSNE